MFQGFDAVKLMLIFWWCRVCLWKVWRVPELKGYLLGNKCKQGNSQTRPLFEKLANEQQQQKKQLAFFLSNFLSNMESAFGLRSRLVVGLLHLSFYTVMEKLCVSVRVCFYCKMDTIYNYRRCIAETNLFEQKYYHVSDSLAAAEGYEIIGLRRMVWVIFNVNSIGFTCSKTS